jgi:glycosyltransferase involved in cell wall biosynthesis
VNILNIVGLRDWDITSYQALHMSLQLQKAGHNAILMCPRDSRLYGEAKKHNLPVKHLTFLAKLGLFAGGLYDIVHFYDHSSANARLLRKIAPLSRVFLSQVRLGGKRTLASLKEFEPYISGFIVSCPSALEDFRKALISTGITFMVPPAINIGRWESAMLIKPGMFQKRPYKVGTISMDRSLKEQGFFLKVAKEVLGILPETTFMVVGLKDNRIRLMARDLEISHKVDVLWDRGDMPEVMAMMHIFVKTSARDCMSMSLIEAQASGVACVVPKVRGLSDFLTHEFNALLVETGSASAYAKAITYLIGNPSACHSISKTAFDRVNSEMTAPAAASLITRLYEQTLAGENKVKMRAPDDAEI